MTRNVSEQAIQDAMVVYKAFKDTEEKMKALVQSIENSIEVILRKSYAQNRANMAMRSTEPSISFTAPAAPNPEFAQQVEEYRKKSEKLNKRNREISELSLEFTMLGKPSDPNKKDEFTFNLDPVLGKKIMMQQDIILEKVNKLGSASKNIERLINTQAAMLSGDHNKADPEVAAALTKSLDEYSALNKELKKDIREQKRIIKEAAPAPAAPTPGMRKGG